MEEYHRDLHPNEDLRPFISPCRCVKCLLKENATGEQIISYGRCKHNIPRQIEDLPMWINYSSSCQECKIERHESKDIILPQEEVVKLRVGTNRGDYSRKKPDVAADFIQKSEQ